MNKYILISILSSLLLGNAFAGLSSQSIESLVKKEKIKTLDELVERLTEKSLNEYVLLYNSASPQKATFQNPRVVSFIDNGKLILGYNNVSDQMEPYQTLDILEFNLVTKAYEGMTLKFDSKGVKAPFLDKDSSSCLNCHSGTIGVQPFRTSYIGKAFPGFYGSKSDTLSSREQFKLDDFLQNFGNQSRYVNLLKNSPSEVSTFGRILNYRQFQGFSPLILSNQNVSQYGYALLAGLQCVGEADHQEKNLDEYIPQTLREKFTKNFEETLKSISEFENKNDKIKLTRRELLLNRSLDQLVLRDNFVTNYPMTSFTYIMSNIESLSKGIKHEIGIIKKTGNDSYGGVKNMTESLYPIVLANNPTLLKIFDEYANSKGSILTEFSIPKNKRAQVCAQLKAESIKSLTINKE